MNDRSIAIEMEKIFFSYSRTKILTNLSLKIFSGEFIGIIGPNGGGKTTFLKLILGFLRPSHGHLKVLGQSPSFCKQNALAYVPQCMQFDKDFPISVEEVILSGLLSQLPWYGKFSHFHRNLVSKVLEEVQLKGWNDHPFGRLSGGQAQRVLIARALISNPKILLLDEPTANVDAKSEVDIFKILEKLKGEMTILMVTHQLQEAIKYFDQVLCIQREVVSFQPEEICQHFAMGLYHTPLIDKKSQQLSF